MAAVEELAKAVAEKHANIDVMINNAGVFSTPDPITPDGLDVRFAVNTIAPYQLTKRLLPLLGNSGRVINLSSAAQATVDYDALAGQGRLPDGAAYAQSKLALTMWSRSMALALKDDGPAIIAVNPKSFIGSKMVKQAYGVAGGDLRIGAEILGRASLSDEFAGASGKGKGIENAEANAKLINKVKPLGIVPTTLSPNEGTQLAKDIADGTFELATERELFEEQKKTIELLMCLPVIWGYIS